MDQQNLCAEIKEKSALIFDSEMKQECATEECTVP
jgi:hypothetical protein